MKIWIICTGEKEGLRPKRCSAQDFDALSRRAMEEDPGPRQEKKLPWEGKQVLTAPCPAAEKTAALLIDGGEVQAEPLLAPVTERASRDSGTAPLWLWREAARIQRGAGSSRQPESRNCWTGRGSGAIPGRAPASSAISPGSGCCSPSATSTAAAAPTTVCSPTPAAASAETRPQEKVIDTLPPP